MKQLPALAASVLRGERKGQRPGVGTAIAASVRPQLLGLAARAANKAVKLAPSEMVSCDVDFFAVGEKTYFRLGIKEPLSTGAGERLLATWREGINIQQPVPGDTQPALRAHF